MTQQINRDAAKQAFASYTARYNAEDPKIKLKIDHTYRVADLCDRISQTVSEVSSDLSWLSGMLHDIGRFEQIRRYNTFSDVESVDHAAFGGDLLFMDNLIDVFGSYDEHSKDVLETAIRNHNRFRIDTGLSDECQAYCKILRDADKIDILRVSYDTPPEEIYNVSSEELRRATVTEEVKRGFRDKRAILHSALRTPVDILVSHISMLHELEYPISIEIVREQGYLAKLLDFKSDNPDTQEWFEYMKESMRGV